MENSCSTKGLGEKEKGNSVSFKETIDFIDKAVLSYVNILPMGLNEYLGAKKIVEEYCLNPSDSIHIATIENYGLQAVASEDEDFDKVRVKR